MKKWTLLALAAFALSATAFTSNIHRHSSPALKAALFYSSSLVDSNPVDGATLAKPTQAPKKISAQATPAKPARPTSTPLKIPPPADPKMTNLLMGFGVLAVVVVIVGVWLNWKRIFKG